VDQQLPTQRDLRTEGILSALKVTFDYTPEYPVDQLSDDELTQVRNPENRGPKKDVDRYYALLSAGASFPPAVADQAGRIIDGNTRIGAYRKDHRKFIPVYLCKISSPVVAQRIGVELNAMAGKRMEREELIRWLSGGNGQVSEEDARRITGWSPDTIRRIRGGLDFDIRRSKLRIKLATALSDSVKSALVKAQNVDVFTDLTKLADDAGLKVGEIHSLVKQANETSLTDAAAARRVISDYRDNCGPRIEERQAGLRNVTPFFLQLSQHAGWFFKRGPSGLHDVDKHTGPKSQHIIEELRDILHEAARRYE
jgi:hypothetical protein